MSAACSINLKLGCEECAKANVFLQGGNVHRGLSAVLVVHRVVTLDEETSVNHYGHPDVGFCVRSVACFFYEDKKKPLGRLARYQEGDKRKPKA